MVVGTVVLIFRAAIQNQRIHTHSFSLINKCRGWHGFKQSLKPLRSEKKITRRAFIACYRSNTKKSNFIYKI